MTIRDSYIKEKIEQRDRLGFAEGLYLLNEVDLLTLGEWATEIRDRKHPDSIVTFVIDRNINYTNICINRCRFCAFYRAPDDPEAYLLTREQIFAKIEETLQQGGTQILMQGGLHPDLSLDWFEKLFSAIKEVYPITLHALSPPEVVHLSEVTGFSIAEVIRRLHAAGLDSIPGGGAEILEDRVRTALSPKKIGTEKWLAVMREAHRQGLRTTATMMFGSVEKREELIRHLLRLRTLQDETGGFTAFIPWSYQPGNTELAGETATGVEYLRILAVSRILLDNFDNLQASWVTQGAKMGQVALFFGANDMGSTMLEENVVAAAGVSHTMTPDEIVRLIGEAGFQPAQRNNVYEILKRFE
ncbi:MAG: dehypoxanthine futalosine cyclase [Deltaproteobacteria bacterium]|nr:dehypoxanthine futalosine cyclase [Deltaproteobacteria bacterium]